MKFSVVAAAREGAPFSEPLEIAMAADHLGFKEVWAGEGPTWDCFALATAIGLKTSQIDLTAGPLPVSVRDPSSIVRGAASAAHLTGRRVGIALGASSKRVVEGFHGVSRAGVTSVLEQTARELSTGLGADEEDLPHRGFRRVLPRPTGQLTVAAFGDRAISVAARFADRMVLDLVTPDQVATLRAKMVEASVAAGRQPPVLAAWLPAAVDPQPRAQEQILSSIAGYLAVPGYADMFIAAGFGEAVGRAREGAEQSELLEMFPPGAASELGLVGGIETIRARIEEYASAGLDEVAIVPATIGDPRGERTLGALASLF